MESVQLNTNPGEDLDGVSLGTNPAGVQRFVVKDLNTLNLAKDLKTFKTSRLVQVGRNFTGLCTLTEDLRSWCTGTTSGGSREGTGNVGSSGANAARHGGDRSESNSQHDFGGGGGRRQR